MGSKRFWIGMLGALLGAAIYALMFKRSAPASSNDDTSDYKELYRESVHMNASNMEAVQRKRHDQAN